METKQPKQPKAKKAKKESKGFRGIESAFLVIVVCFIIAVCIYVFVLIFAIAALVFPGAQNPAFAVPSFFGHGISFPKKEPDIALPL